MKRARLVQPERGGSEPARTNLHGVSLLCILVATACNTPPSPALDASGPLRLDAASEREADHAGDGDLADGDDPQPDARDASPPVDAGENRDVTDASDADIDVGAIDADASAPDAPPRDASSDGRCVLGRSTLGACTL